MAHNVALIRKLHRTRSTWAYLVNDNNGLFHAPDGCLTVQIGTVTEHLHEEIVGLNENLTIISPQLNRHTMGELNQLFPEVHYMTITESSIGQFFDKAIAQTSLRKKLNPNTLYIGADASAMGFPEPIHAAWAWCSDGVNGSYNFGDSGAVNVNVAELEGIMQAIISNAEHSANRIHIYSDSANAVDMFNYDMADNIVPREARKHGMVGLAKDTIEIIHDRKVSVEWVKGHRQHRLNMIADSISRLARKKFALGMSAEDFVHETDVMYSVFNQQHAQLKS